MPHSSIAESPPTDVALDYFETLQDESASMVTAIRPELATTRVNQFMRELVSERLQFRLRQAHRISYFS